MAEALQVAFYDRKPARVVATKVTRQNCHDVARWLREQDIRVFVRYHTERIVYYSVGQNGEEQQITCKFGDWIMRSPLGNFVPCKDKHFKRNYDKVKDV